MGKSSPHQYAISRNAHPPLICVDIVECQHAHQSLLSALRETATRDEFDLILIGAEQAVPQRDVGEVSCMHAILMMNGMQFGGLDEKAQPAGRADVRVVEILAGRGKEVVPKTSRQGTTQNRIKNGRAESRVRQDLDRVLVERRYEFNSRGGMVNLVKSAPPPAGMAQPVPPVEDKCADKPGCEALKDRRGSVRHGQQVHAAKDLQPQFRGRERDQQLPEIHEQRSWVPSLGTRQCATGMNSLPNEERGRGANEEDYRQIHRQI